MGPLFHTLCYTSHAPSFLCQPLRTLSPAPCACTVATDVCDMLRGYYGQSLLPSLFRYLNHSLFLSFASIVPRVEHFWMHSAIRVATEWTFRVSPVLVHVCVVCVCVQICTHAPIALEAPGRCQVLSFSLTFEADLSLKLELTTYAIAAGR